MTKQREFKELKNLLSEEEISKILKRFQQKDEAEVSKSSNDESTPDITHDKDNVA